MRFTVVTPSFRSSPWLKLCIASVADQGVEVEHIIQDAGSDDGTLDWLLTEKRVKVYVEKDRGMYDAVNRGLLKATGDILAYLNCDEQYLPGALRIVAEFFSRNQAVDVVFGDFIVVNSSGHYLFHRKVQVPLKYHLWVSHLPTFTCATFFRRRVIHDYGLLFDPRWRDVGDGEWMLRLLHRRVPMATLRQFTSVFTFTGTNMSMSENARREAAQLKATAPAWARRLEPLIILHHRLRRLLAGAYFQKPFSFSLYTLDSPYARVTRHVSRPISRWRIPTG